MEDFDQVVAEFMREYSFDATYQKSDEGVYDTATGGNVVTVVGIPIRAIQLDLPLTRNGASTINGTLIQDGDKQLFIQPPNKVDVYALPLVVNPASDRVVINGVSWQIVTFKEITPNASNQILIELYIRR